jgi:hypothetical protein
MPAAALHAPRNSTFVQVRHGPCQAGQHTPLAAERQEPVHIAILVAFIWPAPASAGSSLIVLGTGLTVVVNAASGHASSRATSITLHLRLCAALRGIVVGESDRVQGAKPKPPTPRVTLPSNVKLEGTAAGFRADFNLGLQ